MSGSLMLGFDVQRFCNISVHLRAIAVYGHSLTCSDIVNYERRLFHVYKLIHARTHTVSRTYIAVVDETVLPGDVVGFLWPPIDLDSPGVGVDLCSFNPLQFCYQEDKDCP